MFQIRLSAVRVSGLQELRILSTIPSKRNKPPSFGLDYSTYKQVRKYSRSTLHKVQLTGFRVWWYHTACGANDSGPLGKIFCCSYKSNAKILSRSVRTSISTIMCMALQDQFAFLSHSVYFDDAPPPAVSVALFVEGASVDAGAFPSTVFLPNILSKFWLYLVPAPQPLSAGLKAILTRVDE